jgi:hypothetical protein
VITGRIVLMRRPITIRHRTRQSVESDGNPVRAGDKIFLVGHIVRVLTPSGGVPVAP